MPDQPLSSRKRLLHILLWCLAASAASGVLTVLVPQRDLLWRVTAMGFTGAAAIALMIPLSLLVDRERFRAAGLFGMAACVAAFILSTGLIWAGFGGWRLGERFGATLGLVILMSPAVVALLCLRASEAGRVAGLVGLAFAAAAAAVFLIQIWLDLPSVERWPFGGTGAALCWSGLLASLALVGFGTDARHWRWAGVLAALAALALMLYGVWVSQSDDARALTCVMSVAGFVAFANVLLRAGVFGGQRWVVYGTIAAAGAVALFVNLDAFVHEGASDDLFGFRRFAAGALIVTISGTLAVIVLALLNRRATRKVVYAAQTVGGGAGQAGAPLRSINLRCPRCQKEQTLPLGEAACCECRLIIHTRVEVPSCPRCGYDISMIGFDKCPKCGEPIS